MIARPDPIQSTYAVIALPSLVSARLAEIKRQIDSRCSAMRKPYSMVSVFQADSPAACRMKAAISAGFET